MGSRITARTGVDVGRGRALEAPAVRGGWTRPCGHARFRTACGRGPALAAAGRRRPAPASAVAAAAMYEHLTGADTDGEVTINVTVYETEDAAAADLDRAGSSEWFECQRKRIDGTYGDPDPEFEAIPEDPQAPGVAYIERFVAGGEPTAETVHYVFVGQVRATITYCGCTSLGLDGRQTVARDVAAALAEVQGLPAPGREGN